MAHTSPSVIILPRLRAPLTDSRELAPQSRRHRTSRRHPHERIQGIRLPPAHRELGGGHGAVSRFPLLLGPIGEELPPPREEGGGGIRRPLGRVRVSVCVRRGILLTDGTGEVALNQRLRVAIYT